MDFHELWENIVIHKNLDPLTLKLSKKILRVIFCYNKDQIFLCETSIKASRKSLRSIREYCTVDVKKECRYCKTIHTIN